MINLGTILLVLLSLAALIDLFRHKIPNWLTAGGILVGFVWILLDPASTTSLTTALVGILTGLVFFFPVFLFGKIGAGDVKLLSMCGVYLGPVALLWGGLFSLIAGGVFALIWILMLKLVPLHVRRMVPNASSASPFFATRQVQSKTSSANRDLVSDPRRLPYACAIAIGCSLAYLGFK